MKTTIIENMKLTNKLYRALEKNELEVCYQPQINCRTKRIMGVEALLRWNSPEMGIIPPGKFIPIAERTGLILPIGEWTMRTAFKQNKLWQEAGYPVINMAVNISIKQFQNPDLVKQVRDIIAETSLDPKNIELEITESMAMSEKSYIVETLKKFKDIGLHIAIDDFGTEYSSLSYLKHLPIDRIKIAMSFVQGLEAGNKDEAIIKAIIVLAKSMGLGTIAEGVETEYQLDYLKSEMCDEVQGFYYYKPMSASDMERLLKETKL
jgi:EAL domain-containing protein (putative c-di-GMP-specific phosphodiesterase class I)